jgi:cold shock CspA family protein
MQIPLEISYRNIRKRESIESLIKQKVKKLEDVCDYMTSCRIALEIPQKNIRKGNPYRIRISIRVPHSHEVVVRHEPGGDKDDDSLEHIIRETFEAARKQLRELVEKQRREVKIHSQQEVTAIVEKLYPQDGYGFIRTMEGRQLYFHRNSVLHNDFNRIKIGSSVRYFEEEGEDGPQASTVQVFDRPGKSKIPK